MPRWISGICTVALLAGSALAEEPSQPPSKRFESAEGKETVSFQRHVIPLLGRLGCNGRACHGSFQGRGGFRLSLFGYDFDNDHTALTQGKTPRLDVKDPLDSLMLKKPTLQIEHKGGKRLEPDSWQFHALQRWIRAGAKNDATETMRLVRLSVAPDHVVFQKQGETVQIRVLARWSDGAVEDVTELARFRSNNDAVATINESGLATATGKGDTHVVAFYDNGVAPIPVLLPVSDLVGSRYPQQPASTPIDQLVGAKLRQCGIVPAELAADAEFLRRISIDLTGTLPGSAEIEAFLADSSADKRAKKIDDLLARPTYAIWWATRLCDYTGNSGQYREQRFGQDYTRQWYEWMHRRVKDNVSYDKIAAGLVLSGSRKPGQSLEDYSKEMSSYYRGDSPADFSLRETMPHYWARTSFEDPRERALSFSYSFLGVHLQCAQCHKHPFDQWTKKDFEQFTLFFDRIVYGTPPEDREKYVAMMEAVNPMATRLAAKNPDALLGNLVREGKIVPWHEVYVAEPGDTGKVKGVVKPGGKKKPAGPRSLKPKLLGDAELPLDSPGDLRGPLMTWLQKPDNPYFARAFVNRVWASYFNVGIIEPPDDLSLANPPSNAALLDYLTKGFVEHHFDMKWLHREIANSRTYQRSWKPNDTNRLDARNFSHAMPRRMPAEVIYDAIYSATTTGREREAWQEEYASRAIGLGTGGNQKRGKYGNILTVFGKPDRLGNCDCDRSNDPSLLQTLFLLNDKEIQTMLNRPDGWVAQLAQEFGPPVKPAKGSAVPGKVDPTEEAARTLVVANLERRIQELLKKGTNDEAAVLKRVLLIVKQGSSTPTMKPRTRTPEVEEKLIREAYLRTLCRSATVKEIARAQDYLKDSASLDAGIRDLLWALINTDEFIVNH
jgi:Protein of unknown function (DUF1549)/Protein of unknown function (DUF1553)